jgi:hypothetical protein
MSINSLNEKQKEKLCDYVGNLLIEALDEADNRSMLRKHVEDYVKTNKLELDYTQLLTHLTWSVKVSLKE